MILNEFDILDIYQRTNAGETLSSLSKEYGVDVSVCSRIKNRKGNFYSAAFAILDECGFSEAGLRRWQREQYDASLIEEKPSPIKEWWENLRALTEAAEEQGILNKESLLSYEMASQAYNYDPVSGEITHKFNKRLYEEYVSDGVIERNYKVGDIATTENSVGYLSVSFNKRLYLAHRLAFLLMKGHWPREYIDHINGVRDDNRWLNLREATPQQNIWNVGLKRHDTLGFKNVRPDGDLFRWFLKTANGTIGEGGYETPEEAYADYQIAARKHHGEFAYNQ